MRRWLFFVAALACNTPRQLAWETIPDASSDVPPLALEDVAPCKNLECKQVDCSGNYSTRVSGFVFDPAGVVPVPDVAVYIPNAPLDPISAGVSDSACQAPLSGEPLVWTLSDATGHFEVRDAPAGKNIPLVFQLGKFRRSIVVPQVTACVDNPIPSPGNAVHLPRNRAEGSLPRIAVASGCDPFECALWRMGIDESEFTTDPSVTTASVVLFQGSDPGGRKPNAQAHNASELWTSSKTLAAFDAVITSCECTAPVAPNQTAMADYLDKGGRFHAIHEEVGWLQGVSGWKMVAAWGNPITASATPVYIESTWGFPRGAILDAWNRTVFGGTNVGEIDVPHGAASVGPIGADGTRWVYFGDQVNRAAANPIHLSFNTPTGFTNKHGRVIFSDVHFNEAVGTGDFPSYCSTHNPIETEAEGVFEFLFFDMFSCVQNDKTMPIVPPSN